MVKTTRNKTYDTSSATVVKRVACGYYGDPSGYEETVYLTPEGDYFLYTNGGETSPYTTEKITGLSKPAAKKWLDEH